VDIFPTILHAIGALDLLPPELPGESVLNIANAPYDPQRTVFSEYHAAGGVSASYMLREGRYKYIHYTGFAPELFDLETDSEELHDLTGDPAMAPVLCSFLAKLQSICEPEATDRAAKQDQQALIKRHGGASKILSRGGSSYTPIPGEAVKLIENVG
jgi:choline-sulfatase